MSPIRIETLAGGDIDQVAAIHAQCFDDAWSADMIGRVLATIGAFGLVGRRSAGGAIVAFALGRVIVDECELLSLGVAPGRRQQGFGGALLDAAMARAAAGRARRFFLEVGEHNTTARRLYESRGMFAIGRRPAYYELSDGGVMDALTMRGDLTPLHDARGRMRDAELSPSMAGASSPSSRDPTMPSRS